MITVTMIDTHAQNMVGWVALEDGQCLGHVFLRLEPGGKIKFMDAWVDEDHRRRGIYRMLWDARWEYAVRTYPGRTAFAWCLEKSLPLAVEKGFDVGEICTYVERVLN